MNKVFLQRLLVCTGFVAVYLLLSYTLVGFKSDQLFLSGLFSLSFLVSERSRDFIKAFSIFIVYWIIFDYMKAFPNYQYNSVSIKDLYTFEKNLFGIDSGNQLLTPNEYFDAHHIPFLDILTGIFYLCWVPVPLAFATYLYIKNKQQFYAFSLTFLLVNLLGFVVYYLYPAAPPWYVKQYGFDFIANTPGNTGGLAHFDALTGTPIFGSIYAKSSNVFAAMPSLHSSYPVIVLYYGIKNKLGWVNGVFALVMAGIWFAAVYNGHHYVLDVLAGILCAILGIWLFNRYITRLQPVKNLVLLK